MKSKWSLFVGLAILTTGIILKFVMENPVVPWLIIITGVVFKIYFILNKIIKTGYQPGYELLLLMLGLTLFFFGMYLKSSVFFIEPVYFKIVGILFKVSFIIFFIRKTKFSK